MDDRDRLALYPYVVVRIRCRVCSRKGAFRLARLAPKFGPEIGLRDLVDRFSYDCLWRAEAHGKRGVSACGVCLPDLDQPRRPTCRPGSCASVSWSTTIDGWRTIEVGIPHMCNLYSETKGQAAIRGLFRTSHDRTGNLPAFPWIFPDQLAPIVRNSVDGMLDIVARGEKEDPPVEGVAV